MKTAKQFWNNKKYHLEDMTFTDLVIAYIQYPAIQVYFVIALLGFGYLTVYNQWSLMLLLTAVIIAIIYPLIWYMLHRYVLHASYLYKSPYFAKVWKRIHFDHHRDPNDLRVLFGALYTTLPTVIVFTLPIGWALADMPGAIAAIISGVVVTMFYEFCHCIQHLHYTPKQKFLRDMKRLHLLHHYRDETGNYGITNYFWDRVLGTFYDKDDKRDKSPTVFNLGYNDQEAVQYPWVDELVKSSK